MKKRPESTVGRYLLLGSDIQNSISPAIQNAAFRYRRIEGIYELYQLRRQQFAAQIEKIVDSRDVRGFNITAPFKEMIVPYLAKLDSRSKSVGAVNTVKVLRNRKMIGYNTDVDGIIFSLNKLRAQSGTECTILGAGGAARACLYAVLRCGYTSVTILNRTLERALNLQIEYQKKFARKAKIRAAPLSAASFKECTERSNLLINAITNPFPFKPDFSRATRNLAVFDLGYKEPSILLREAKKANIKSLDGLLMLVEQGAKSFEIWTGNEAPRKEMLSAAKKTLPRLLAALP